MNTNQKNKDWSGSNNSPFVCNGASNHSMEEREKNDYYATEPKAVELLLEQEKFSPYIWEPACGEGHISKVLKNYGYKVYSTDLIKREYNDMETRDFFSFTKEEIKKTIPRDIITNPPYKIAKNFVEHALDISMDGTKIAMFLKLTFLESKSRKELFKKYPFKTLYVSSSRLSCGKNGNFNTHSKNAVAYGWFVWKKGFYGDPIIKWIN